MIGATILGVLIVVVVAANQLGSRVTGTFDDPGINYPAALLDGRTIGNADAPVTLEVWEDYQCPVCARHTLSVEPLIVEQYVKPGILRIVKKDLAFLGRGGADDESRIAASGAVCSNQQDKYWDYTLWLYNNQDGENAGGFRRERVKAIAEAAGVDVTNWDTCIDARRDGRRGRRLDDRGRGPGRSTPRPRCSSAGRSSSASRRRAARRADRGRGRQGDRLARRQPRGIGEHRSLTAKDVPSRPDDRPGWQAPWATPAIVIEDPMMRNAPPALHLV